MSTSSSSRSRPALGARTNFFESDSDEYRASDDDPRAGHDELAGTEREEWIAHEILKQTGTVVCPECHHQHDRSTELSEPSDHVAISRVEGEDGIVVEFHADHRRSRHCPTCGHLGGGLIRDRAEWRFIAVVETVLDCVELPHSQRKALVSDARSRKQRGTSDVPNLQQTLHDLQHGRGGGQC